MSSLFNKYVRVPTSSTLPTSTSDTRGSSSGFGRARTRWALIGAALFALLLFFGLASSDSAASATIKAKAGQYAGRLPWSSPSKPTGFSSVTDVDGSEFSRWINGSGRTDLRYDSPFNPEDLTLTEDECDAFFPGLWKEIDRSVEYYTEHPMTAEYLDKVCDDGIWSHARVVIHNNRVHLKYFQQSAFTRVNSALALLDQAVMAAREKLPDAEFCLSANDWGSMGKFSLDRAPYLVDLWLMPDYGFYSWPEPGIGSYTNHREKTLAIDQKVPWSKKIGKLFWRGAMGVGTADRKALLAASKGQPWSDVEPLDWANRKGFVTMEDHCKWKYHAFPEGMTYSGRLRYLQNCRSVIVTHEPRWIQHWTHLYNADPTSPDQNIVFVPEYTGEDPGVEVEDERGNVYRDRTWMRLPEVMDALLADDDKAKRIADNQWSYFRERYVSPASAACYWRKAIKAYAGVQQFKVNYTGTETSYESFILLGNKLQGIPQ
ncbi:Lipopolysaccharide-modifying protein [Kalmanozyma brasiliensis GHG001]|uniref:Endoplasmic reticulum protein EP58 n=1 Tax=Kalmanozyma brasiliensis (strain GHG001) TaxID=1365824 RepID=V5GU24_KALBG|nr:Lipopolysaccharide-modifying protein [Kalmanozyma brasiliensis GHG001]EST09407.1 Lipopolysaccharide-modifying protein [Kalmanozyma brasiliensis GHG001]